MAIFKRRAKRQDRPMEAIFYRDYIQSGAWELRKRRYFEHFAKRCQICGDAANIHLDHIKYGNYGHERDRDLVPLCDSHHKKLHETIAGGGDMQEHTALFLIEQKKKYDAEHVGEIEERVIRDDYAPSLMTSVDAILHMTARPIWRLFYGVFRW